MLQGFSFSSGWQDSNLRPPAPKAGAMTGLRYTPNCKNFTFNFAVILSLSKEAAKVMK